MSQYSEYGAVVGIVLRQVLIARGMSFSRYPLCLGTLSGYAMSCLERVWNPDPHPHRPVLANRVAQFIFSQLLDPLFSSAKAGLFSVIPLGIVLTIGSLSLTPLAICCLVGPVTGLAIGCLGIVCRESQRAINALDQMR